VQAVLREKRLRKRIQNPIVKASQRAIVRIETVEEKSASVAGSDIQSACLG
jgi:hypothetical protein